MNDSSPGTLTVEVVYARRDRQRLVELQVPQGSTVADAVRQSGISREFPDIDSEQNAFGVWGHPVSAERLLKSGDRVEIYRPLAMDPREARRQLALHGKAMGGSPGAVKSPD